jgi:GT2 family glycosyltransferase
VSRWGITAAKRTALFYHVAVILRFLGTAAGKGWSALRDGRFPPPTLWMRHLRNHWSDLIDRPLESPELLRCKRALAGDCTAELERFLASGQQLALPTSDEPLVSILIVAYNRAELLLRCLRSLHAAAPFEVVIVDNGSTDRTRELLDRTSGARRIDGGANLGFPAAVNRAARVARGRHLLFLNHDAAPLSGSIDAALAALGEGVGAVGARLLLSDGSLQEAGSIIGRDGSCAGCGRGDKPDQPEHMFRRDVDYCSAAFLLTPRAIFEELGGFDEGYGPAYYEDVDYCVRLQKRGFRVVYDPDAVVAHFEFASSHSIAAKRMQAERRARFVAAHRDWLERPRARKNLRVLVIDDRVPHAHLGSGWPRAQAMVRALVDAGHQVTFFPLMFPDDDWAAVRGALPSTVEVMLGLGVSGLRRFLDERDFDRMIVSRPENLKTLRARARRWPPLVYDAEALFALRDGTDVRSEVELARGAHAVIAVSQAERGYFEGVAPAFMVGHALEARPTPASFAAREGILFVGAFHHDRSPNSEGMRWFMREVWPALKKEKIPLTVVGVRPPRLPDVQVLERVEDLTPLYDRARLFIAPVFAGAGLPYKIHHAAAHGVPVVATSLLARLLGWREELAIADQPQDFAARCLELYHDEQSWTRLRASALARVATDCSPRAFAESLSEALR